MLEALSMFYRASRDPMVENMRWGSTFLWFTLKLKINQKLGTPVQKKCLIKSNNFLSTSKKLRKNRENDFFDTNIGQKWSLKMVKGWRNSILNVIYQQFELTIHPKIGPFKSKNNGPLLRKQLKNKKEKDQITIFSTPEKVENHEIKDLNWQKISIFAVICQTLELKNHAKLCPKTMP